MMEITTLLTLLVLLTAITLTTQGMSNQFKLAVFKGCITNIDLHWRKKHYNILTMHDVTV